MRILTYTSLYPNAAQPNHGIFVENRLRQLVKDGQLAARVVAPVPWFPLRGRAFGRYADYALVPHREERHGVEVHHPRYPVIPKVGMTLAPLLMYAWTRPLLARLLRTGFDFDLIDAHYFYPDGVAAALLGRYFDKPVTITARGTDINLIARYALAGKMIRWAAGKAAGLITVSRALKDALSELGVRPERVRVLRNGVDLDTFQPGDPAALRQTLGLRPPVLLSVGNLLPFKGHDLAVEALARLPEASLLIVGQGPAEPELRALIQARGLAGRVHMLGAVPHSDMARVYNAADVLVLASAREGWPNVLLEAMACGTPAVATRVGGIPEVLAEPAAGRLMARRDEACLAETLRALLADPPARAATRAYAEGFGWEATTQGQLELFRGILARRPAA